MTMRRIIGIIVPASNERLANEEANKVMIDLFHKIGIDSWLTYMDTNTDPFDYVDDPQIWDADSDEGSEFIQKLVDEMQDQFMNDLKTVRDIIAESKDLLGLEEDEDLRMACDRIGKRTGTHVLLYSWERSGITNQTELDMATDPYILPSGKKFYVVPAIISF